MQTPSTMTIGKRLAFGFGLVLALMIALTGFGIQKVDFIERTLTEITDVNAVKQRYAINFRGSVHDRAISLRDVTLLESPADLTATLAEIDRLAAFYSEAAQALDSIFAADNTIPDEEKVLLGQVPIITLHTPGHTPGSMSFHVPNDQLVLAGDTLFRGSIGRTDLWGGNFEAIEESIRERLYTLDDATTVVTGHGPETEIGLEKESNQFVRL